MIESQIGKRAKHIESSFGPPPGRRAANVRREVRPALLALGLFASVGVSVIVVWSPRWMTPAKSGNGLPVLEAREHHPNPLPNLPYPDLLRPLTPEEAQTLNGQRPIVDRSDDPAERFRFAGDAVSKLRAIDCLSQAIYYEAVSEGVDGGRAVAQVVLNRVRHPGYPNSVCGVVYQGSNRPTGCQFSFTCDGSLARIPDSYLWARSRLIAAEALAGKVFGPVGHATYYHANYVLPYWADSLDKVAVIGRHIFYRLRGGNGSQAAFGQRYAAREPSPPPPPVPEVIENALKALDADSVAAPSPLLLKVEEDKIAGLAVGKNVEAATNLPLQADISHGQLILGEPSTAAKIKSRSAGGCGSSRAPRNSSLIADDLKSGAGEDC